MSNLKDNNSSNSQATFRIFIFQDFVHRILEEISPTKVSGEFLVDIAINLPYDDHNTAPGLKIVWIGIAE